MARSNINKVCHSKQSNDAKGLVGYKHWNSHPIVFVYDKYKQPIINTNDAFKISNWCPLLNKYKENRR